MPIQWPCQFTNESQLSLYGHPSNRGELVSVARGSLRNQRRWVLRADNIAVPDAIVSIHFKRDDRNKRVGASIGQGYPGPVNVRRHRQLCAPLEQNGPADLTLQTVKRRGMRPLNWPVESVQIEAVRPCRDIAPRLRDTPGRAACPVYGLAMPASQLPISSNASFGILGKVPSALGPDLCRFAEPERREPCLHICDS